MNNEIIFYSTPDGDKKVEVLFQDENFWLTQKALAGLFGVEIPAVSKHLKNIFESGELVADSVVSILETTAADGKIYKTKYYNLDAIIAVGYRVNSYQATQFLDSFLELSNYPILEDKGKVSATEAKLKAEQEYGTYRKRQDQEFISDFDREIKRIQGKHKQESNDE